ncbi:transglutaminase-like domain-containing protein [Rubrivivax gelatinosus]|uniref:Transglutaminase superfamily protein n=1 Tax=Rubrivivax gelatinosus TaxID=28068 RepID=A0A4R2MB05_RUBGE|nr:transglutaminase family protein [Rubrivivax gelatinosus]MBK1687823.1 transglutaminase [Rubrivivax gelatinosus]TCP03441.1 transglutaminase superfamily protein [Rubrivivax gelatinosus]
MIRIDLAVELCYEVEGAGGADFVFNIQAAQTPCQVVDHERLRLSQAITPAQATDPATASRFVRLHAGPGELRVNYEAVVEIRHHLAEPDALQEVPVRDLPLEVMPYLYPSRYCQSDRLLALAAHEFGGLVPGYSRVLAVQHWVQKQVRFVANSSDSTTSAVDTLIERVGVCRDFAHLMIALCRALNMPARVVSGTDFGADPALGPHDFHAYAEVYLGDRWYLFDPSGTGVPMGFVRLGTGRDAADVAFATLFGRVRASAPRIVAQARTDEGAQAPRHCREALSSTGPTPVAADGRIAFGTSVRGLADEATPRRCLPR